MEEQDKLCADLCQDSGCFLPAGSFGEEDPAICKAGGNAPPPFWAIVAERMPGYRQQEAELKALQWQLSLFDL